MTAFAAPLISLAMSNRYANFSREELVRLLERRDAGQRYGLVWEREGIEQDRAVNDDYVVLDLDQELSTPPSGEAGWRNLVIEGDNWDALRVLRLTHAGAIKCILIDPPYNTGAKDFAYNDFYVGKDDRFRHSLWLEFLYKRLLLARDLMADDGVILVCINDENRARLDLLMEQVFPGMRVGSFVWRTKDTANNSKERSFSGVHEHVLIYGQKSFRFTSLRASSKKFRLMPGDTARSRLDPITMAQDLINRENTYYPIQDPATELWYPCSPLRVWSIWSKRKPTKKKNAGPPIEDMIEAGRIFFPIETKPPYFYQTKSELEKAILTNAGPIDGKKRPLLRLDLPDLDFWVGKRIAHGRPSIKTYAGEDETVAKPISSWIANSSDKISNLEIETLIGERQGVGTDVLMQIFGDKIFDFPKPPGLIKELISASTDDEDLVLDFFAGSATTAHAVLALNTEDEGDRKFIMVSNTEATANEPTKNLCRDVCAMRIRRVIDGNGDIPALGGNFAYLRTRRIEEGDVLYDLDPAALWTLIQLRHGRDLIPYSPNRPIQISLPPPDDVSSTTLVYVPIVTDAAISALEVLGGALSPSRLRRLLCRTGFFRPVLR